MSTVQSLPDYRGLVVLFMGPLLDNPETLCVDCEVTAAGQQVWLRISFDSSNKGKVFGRGGRTIQAIRQVLTAAAMMAHQHLYIEIFENKRELHRSPRLR